jgi:lipopolysaccharide transport system ATP-binding protein
MSETIITVQGLGKKYRLGQRSNERYKALRDVLTQKAQGLFRRGHNGQSAKIDNEIWALRDVSFEVKRGEVIGIIGRNGAGKSTLLKILSRITEPTEGRVRLKGRVASLLEVGTGFHPELTGRENIFLNGAILGMTRAEIQRKFDEIVDFAEIENFLDTPVKRYSSGMYVRLAFAVAAHLEPEILVVDEVLAVGDAEFQKKCLGKMEQVSRTEGRTVLFVSHNMAAVKNLTHTTVVIDSGRITFGGGTEQAVAFYLASLMRNQTNGSRSLGSGAHTAIKNVKLLGEKLQPTSQYIPGTDLMIEVTVETDGASSLSLEVFLLDSNRTKLAIASTYQLQGVTLPDSPGQHICHLKLQPLWLASGTYSLDVTTSKINQNWDHYVENALSFDVIASNPLGFSWDFKSAYGYGAFAMLCVEPPSFELVR